MTTTTKLPSGRNYVAQKTKCRALKKAVDEAGNRIPCGNWSLLGLEVCRYHGGSTPNSKAKAERARQEIAVNVANERALSTLSRQNPELVRYAADADPVEQLAVAATQLSALAERCLEIYEQNPTDTFAQARMVDVMVKAANIWTQHGKLTVPKVVEINARVLAGDADVVLDLVVNAVGDCCRGAVLDALAQPIPKQARRTIRSTVA